MNEINKLSLILAGLILVSVVLYWAGAKQKTTHADKTVFAIADTTQISGLTIQVKNELISITKKEDHWVLNDKYSADPQLIYLFQRIVQAVQTQRPVSRTNFEEIKSELQASASQVSILLANGQTKKFYAGGNQAKTTAYFANEDFSKIFLVAIPGYKSYISGIFELSLNQWRDRVLFSSSWRTLQAMTIHYVRGDRPGLSIEFKDRFLAVDGVQQLDTTALMNYLKPLEFFQVNDYLVQGNFPRYDSLLSVAPLAKLSLKDIDTNKDQELTVYPKIPGEQFYLITNTSDEMIVLDQNRVEALLVDPSVFREP